MDLVAIDLGGTHCRFGTVRLGDGAPQLDRLMVARVADHADLAAAWGVFAAGGEVPRRGAMAVACRADGGVLRLTNNPWTIDSSRVAADLGLDDLHIVNDFAAVAHAVDALPPGDFSRIAGPATGLPSRGVVTIVGPGTGLGVAQLVRTATGSIVVPTEGGHGDFAPRDAIDDRVLARLRAKHGRVSNERVVAGSGLAEFAAAIAEATGRTAPPRSDVALWTAALDGSDPDAVAALDQYIATLGAVAGDLALAQGADAVVIAGGLGLRLHARLAASGFAAAFVAKGRFAAHMKRLPVLALTHAQPGLVGAAIAARYHHVA